MPDNLILIGFMGVGKTTVGRQCARLLGYAFRDTDQLISERAGRSIPEIFAEEGEAGFRARERAVVESLTSHSRQVIATGGGVVLDPSNTARLRAAGMVAALRARPETLVSRVGDVKSRPLLASSPDPVQTISIMLEQRSSLYERHSHRGFDTDACTPAHLADQIVNWYTESRVEPERVDVSLPTRSYPILVRQGMVASGEASQQILTHAPSRRVCIVTHPGLLAKYATPIETGLRDRGVSVSIVTIPAGERYKTLGTVARLYGAFLQAGLDRKGLVVAVGGGVLGDVAGFAAASYLRGIRIVQVPTTLLAQVDSSVGGKTGVDLPAGKNLVGAFHQPSLVLIDPRTLTTLPARELRSGLAEIIKYGIIYDAEFFAEIGRQAPILLRRTERPLTECISRSCRIKADVVGQDETEQGLRAILNFGHTIGHALETVTRYRRYKHGEAISIGMISAALIGEEIGVTPPSLTNILRSTLESARLPVAFPNDIELASILDAARRDKKTEDGLFRFVLAREIGSVYVHNDVPVNVIVAALERQRSAERLNG